MLNKLTLLKCTPRLRWIPEHSIQINTHRLRDTQSGFSLPIVNIKNKIEESYTLIDKKNLPQSAQTLFFSKIKRTLVLPTLGCTSSTPTFS